MSLDFSFTGVKDYEKICHYTDSDGVVNISGVTQNLIWLTLFVGLDTITEKNADRFYARVQAWERLSGPLRIKDGQPLFTEREEVLQHVGLKTNAAPYTKAEFKKRLLSAAWAKAVPDAIDKLL